MVNKKHNSFIKLSKKAYAIRYIYEQARTVRVMKMTHSLSSNCTSCWGWKAGLSKLTWDFQTFRKPGRKAALTALLDSPPPKGASGARPDHLHSTQLAQSNPFHAGCHCLRIVQQMYFFSFFFRKF